MITHEWQQIRKDCLEQQTCLPFISLSIPGVADHSFSYTEPCFPLLHGVRTSAFYPSVYILIFYVLNISHSSCFYSYLTLLFSCLPSLRELSNNRSLDNLDCIGGTGPLASWDEDDFSQACSTLGRRGCMGQVSLICHRQLNFFFNSLIFLSVTCTVTVTQGIFLISIYS